MGFRFRRSARLGPLRLNFGKSDLSSISLGASTADRLMRQPSQLPGPP